MPIEHQESSGNVFRDIGVAHPEEALAKAEIARAICLLIESDHLTQSQAAKQLDIDQPAVSRLLRGRLAEFSIDRLLRFLMMLGRHISIHVQKASSHQSGVTVSME